MLRLHVRKHPDQFIKISSSISLGSNKNNDLVLNSSSVSDFHAEILVEGEKLAIVDLLSTGGTFVNSHLIAQKTSIKPWDIIQLGNVELELVDPNSCRPGDWGLRSKSNSLAAKVYPLIDSVVLGRDASSDLRIESNLLSRQHARITIAHDRLQVCDLNSTNGTYLNGKRIEQADAFPGDELRFDQLIFEVIGPALATDATVSDETVLRDQDDDATALAQADEEATRFAEAPMPVAFITDHSGLMQSPKIQLIKMQYGVGRHPDSDICINDNSLSKHHAKLLMIEGQWWIEDQNSSNGTWINSERINKACLDHGDIIRLGRVEMEYSINGAAEIQRTRIAPADRAHSNAEVDDQTLQAKSSTRSFLKLALWTSLLTLVCGAAAYWVVLTYL